MGVVSDSLNPAAEPAVAVGLIQPGYVIWHIKWRWVAEKQQYWALYAAYPITSYGCASDDLFFATSADGKNWKTFPVPMLSRLDARFNFQTLYRATFLYDASGDKLQVIASALENKSGWGEFAVTSNYSRLVAALNLSLGVPSSALQAVHHISLRLDEKKGKPFLEKWP